ncbi:TetR/AcrR family transcriptional regulator [Leptospira sp. 201903071]|uniref:TetR/AcrR family transcriptional regulator n=1 Tax=Leptospira ainazelensis TaxID=2810034 RepID=UPI0019658D60|nr:TetR/AcrR family transcriptional regulator [Leptospira ainazelensis]MBM9502054.1 TetR/AcrR family transcriptional regulator [Leptospira ainazelensis]
MGPKPTESIDRKTEILNSALLVFFKYGFRKTSMDEVARAADVSRQGLYLHFATKEDLFRAVVQNTLQNSLDAAKKILNDNELSIEERIASAFDAWMGQYVGMLASGASDLVEAGKNLVGPTIYEYEERFLKGIGKTIQESDLKSFYSAAGLKVKDLVETLNRTSIGLKHSSGSRAEFKEGINVAVRILCTPLGNRYEKK